MYMYYLIIMPVFPDPVAWYIRQPRHVRIMLGVEGIAGMRRNKLQRIFLRQIGLMPFPARNVMNQRRSFVIIRGVLQQALRDKLEFAGVSAQLFPFFGIPLGITEVRRIAFPAFIEPAQAGRRFIIFQLGYDIIAFFLKFFEGDILGKVG